jgi:putative two-component system response regulator
MPMRVLIADDDKVLSHQLAARLRALGWRVDLAVDAMQTLMFAMRNPPDVIVLDIQMPGGTGLDALKKLQTSVKTSQIPVVVLSGTLDAGAEQSVLALGAVQFVPKPVEPDVLHEIILVAAGGGPAKPGPPA